MSFALGDTFLIADHQGVDHLCVVISDPAQDSARIALAVLTTRETWKEEVCVLYPGEHPFIQHDTCVDYAFFDSFFSLGRLEAAIAAGKAKLQAPVRGEVLRKILNGAAESRSIPMGHWNLLYEQRLIEQ